MPKTPENLSKTPPTHQESAENAMAGNDGYTAHSDPKSAATNMQQPVRKDGYVIHTHRRGKQTIYEDPKTYHLGDENFRSKKWVHLYGKCYVVRFTDDGSVGHYYLSMQLFGNEAGEVYVNRRLAGYLPRQHKGQRKRPNYWGKRVRIEIPSSMLAGTDNQLSICSGPALHPEFPGDIDDLQIRNIKLIKQY